MADWSKTYKALREQEPAPSYADLLAEIERQRAQQDTLVRQIIDETWGEALEDGSVPSTKLQDKIIAAVRARNEQSGSKRDG